MQEDVPLERSASAARSGAFFQGVLEDHGIEVARRRRARALRGRRRRVGEGRDRGRARDRRRHGRDRRRRDARRDARQARPGSSSASAAASKCSATLRDLGAGRLRRRRHLRVRLGRPRPPAAGRALGAWRLDQGKTAALNMLGERVKPTTRSRTSCRTSPTGRRSSTSARRVGWDEEVVRGSLDDGEFTIFYLDGGRVAGARSRSGARTTSSTRGA